MDLMGTDLQVQYRPSRTENFIGNDAIVKSIKADNEAKTLQHTIMLTGPSGIGKTTLAYIIAKSFLKCHDQYIIEKNAADTRGIDDVRQLLQNVANRPLVGTNKVYIIDEAHQLTTEAQNALLKPLENPRLKHVYWIFCTTNPAKIIKTIKTRCAQYSLESLSSKEINRVLQPIIERESISLPEEIIKIIVQKSDGIPREAVKLLDQLRNLSDKEEVLRVIEQYKTEQDEFAKMMQFLKQPWHEVGPKLKKLYEKKEPDSIRIGICVYNRVVLENSGNIRSADMACEIIDLMSDRLTGTPPQPELTSRLYKLNKILNRGL